VKLLGLRDLAGILGVSYATVRQYASVKRYPDFPARKECPTCEGVGSGFDEAEVRAWHEARPGRGGGDLRADPSGAVRSSWTTRRAAPEATSS
jgi:hypothetical protein